MKNKIYNILLIAILALVLTSCGKSKDVEVTETEIILDESETEIDETSANDITDTENTSEEMSSDATVDEYQPNSYNYVVGDDPLTVSTVDVPVAQRTLAFDEYCNTIPGGGQAYWDHAMERGADGVNGSGMYVYEHGKGAGNGESYLYDPATGHVYHIGEAIGSGDNTSYYSGTIDEMILAAARYADGASFPTIPESKVNSYPSWAGTCNE